MLDEASHELLAHTDEAREVEAPGQKDEGRRPGGGHTTVSATNPESHHHCL